MGLPPLVVLAPVTAPRHACPRCGGRLVHLEEPTCLPCGWVDYSLPGLTCGICREPLTGDRQRYCSTACVTRAGNRRKAQAARMRRARRRCVRCGIPTNGGTYCPRHKASVRSLQLDWRARRRAAGRCLKCPEPRVNATHCTRHRIEHKFAGRGSPPGAACGWPLPAVRQPQGHGKLLRAPSRAAQRARRLKRFRRWATWPRQLRNAPAPDVCSELQEPRGQRIHR